MSDDQLCAKCGHPRSNHPYRHPFVGPSRDNTIREQADRIEELQAQVNGLLRQASDNHDALCRAEAAEAKLYLAVDAFTRIDDLTCHNMPMTAREEQAVNREVRAALAELEEQTDE